MNPDQMFPFLTKPSADDMKAVRNARDGEIIMIDEPTDAVSKLIRAAIQADRRRSAAIARGVTRKSGLPDGEYQRFFEGYESAKEDIAKALETTTPAPKSEGEQEDAKPLLGEPLKDQRIEDAVAAEMKRLLDEIDEHATHHFNNGNVREYVALGTAIDALRAKYGI